jgi:phage gpG-like protein
MATTTGLGSGLAIDISWKPALSLLASGFDTMSTSIKSFKVPLERSIREVMSPSIAENFASGGRPDWTPLSEFTIQKKGFDTILVETGSLASKAPQYNNWTVDGPNGEARLDRLSVEHGYYHQEGFVNHWTSKFTPARTWAMFQPEDGDRVEEIFWEWLEERWDRDVAMGRI